MEVFLTPQNLGGGIFSRVVVAGRSTLHVTDTLLGPRLKHLLFFSYLRLTVCVSVMFYVESVAKSLVKRLGDNKRLRKMIFSAHSLPGQHLTVAAFRVDIF